MLWLKHTRGASNEDVPTQGLAQSKEMQIWWKQSIFCYEQSTGKVPLPGKINQHVQLTILAPASTLSNQYLLVLNQLTFLKSPLATHTITIRNIAILHGVMERVLCEALIRVVL